MKTTAFLTDCKDILCGLAVAALAVLFSAVAHGASGQLYFIAVIAAIVFLAAAVRLLRAEQKRSRLIRGITAVIEYIPLLMLDGRSGIDSAERMFRLMNASYAAEYGGPAIGNVIAYIFLILPGTLMLILLAIFLARHTAAPKQQPPSQSENAHV